jgi:mono/diheme cytochrome c family protein
VPLALTGYQIGLLAVALTFITFALVVALVIPRWRPEFPSRYLGWFIGVAIVLFVSQLTAVLLLAELGEESKSEAAPPTQTQTQPTETGPTQTTPTETAPTGTTGTSTGATQPPPPAQGDPAAGKQIFASQPCGGCHTLADAGTTGTVGPNLDQKKPPFALVVERVTNGKSPMPSFKGTLTEQQINDVAAYVSSVAGK